MSGTLHFLNVTMTPIFRIKIKLVPYWCDIFTFSYKTLLQLYHSYMTMWLQLDVHYGVPVDPDERDKPADDWDIRACSQIIKRHLPDVEDKPAIIERCIYTVEPVKVFCQDSITYF